MRGSMMFGVGKEREVVFELFHNLHIGESFPRAEVHFAPLGGCLDLYHLCSPARDDLSRLTRPQQVTGVNSNNARLLQLFRNPESLLPSLRRKRDIAMASTFAVCSTRSVHASRATGGGLPAHRLLALQKCCIAPYLFPTGLLPASHYRMHRDMCQRNKDNRMRQKILDRALSVTPLDTAAMEQARSRQQQLTKPAGSLGRLEDIAIQMAGISGQPLPDIKHKAVIVMAADH